MTSCTPYSSASGRTCCPSALGWNERVFSPSENFFRQMRRWLATSKVVATMPSPPGHPQHDQFLRLYAEHEVALHTFVRSLLPTRQEASEVMQEVIVALWQGFASAGEFRPWAFGVARNQVRMYLRGRVRDRHVFDDELVNRLADLAVMQEPQHLTEREALDACLQKLPASQKELVLAAYTKGVRMDDLATRRGQTPMSLYKLLHRIRQALLECVERTLAKEELA